MAVKVSLSDSGDVRSARLFSDTLRRGVGSQDIARATILATVASTYTPEIKGCRPIAGVYLFEGEYVRK